MDHVRMRDNSSNPHPTQDPAAPFEQISPLLSTPNGREYDAEDPPSPSPPSSTANSQHPDEKFWFSSLKSLRLKFRPRRSKPLIREFERPRLSRIAILAALCLITYPAFCILKLVAKDRSLFVVRSIVSVWCSGVGFALGYILIKIGARHLEAASEFAPIEFRTFLRHYFQTAWATVIHMSYEGDGMKLRDLARGSSDSVSVMPAFHIFRSRFRDRGTSRRSRKSYESVPRSSSALPLLTLLQQTTMVPILGILCRPRHPGSPVTLRIRTYRGDQSFRPRTYYKLASKFDFLIHEQPQRKAYSEVLIAGDLTEEDIGRAGTWEFYQTADPDTPEFVYGDDAVNTVYFAQPTPSQFVPGGSGAGTFDAPPPVGVRDPPNNTLASTGRNIPKDDTGAILRYASSDVCLACGPTLCLRYSQWGIRIHCEKLPDPGINM